MSNRLSALLSHWYDRKDDCQWVLASIIETQRSSYRKTGAMMLINSLGKSYGLLSGGCLEADLMRQAQKCWQTNQAITVCYDMQDDSDISWQLGIGCGGLVKVLIQPIQKSNGYLDLLTLKNQLDNRNHCFYHIDINKTQQQNRVLLEPDTSLSLLIEIKPAPCLVIFGGGIDAQPIVTIAKTLGWYTCVIDSRTAYARAAYFQQADRIIKEDYAVLEKSLLLPSADAVIIMHHNVPLDAHALTLVTQQKQLLCAQYVGILGPQHRTTKVMQAAALSVEQLSTKLANPIGLDLGGDLPESIALSILSQVHATLENKSANALGYFTENLCPDIRNHADTPTMVNNAS